MYIIFSGKCEQISDSIFHCECLPGWTGYHCESMINFCHNITCVNGICRPLLLNYTCECFRNDYSGRHCEITSAKLFAIKIVSKSFTYVAIIALVITCAFIIIMDILKYCFGIDPIREDLEKIRQKRRARDQKSRVIQRLVYVDASTQSSE